MQSRVGSNGRPLSQATMVVRDEGVNVHDCNYDTRLADIDSPN